MRKSLCLLGAAVIAVSFTTGCANAEKKFGRGMGNTMEILRLGEMRRTVEQTALFGSPDEGYTYGFVRGINRSLARTGIGIYEMVTFPFPPYDPVFTDYLTPAPAYPDNNKPALLSDSLFATDSNLGFSGGDVMPFIPGNRFRIFETH